MKRSKFFVGAWLAAMAAGCMVGDPDLSTPTPSFEEFRDQTYLEPWEGGAYIVNGDTPIHGEKALREFYDSVFGEGELIVHRSGGADAKWTDTQKLNLTYCVSNNFGSNKATVVEAFRQATDLGWEVRGNVNFIYVPAEDANCTATNNNVVFDVRPISGQSYLARAFFPDQGRSGRNVIIDSSSFGNVGWPLKNIIAHELGHALGFRHEHTRPEAGTCFEDTSWRALTPYDSGSVMHYPQCNGSSQNLAFTQRDADGIAALYGAPGGNPPPPPPPDGVDKTQNWSGSVGLRVSKQLPPALAVIAGSTLTVSMTGSGDPDLYVRFGSAPTTSSYACRPYLDSATEKCTLSVPAGQTTAYVMVRGFSSATYAITATYRAPN